jgi:hypothetical protein
MSDTPEFYLDNKGLHFDCPHSIAYWDAHEGTQNQRIDHRLPIGPDGWTIVSTDPLTVTPSILKPECGCHGFITNGKWVAC